ncbi:unnamed protein product [Periconia digitata]|uniref:Rhodopsin domain-containing protein n=1 Tax=Periconia digitata TaxID=1303443 RepID=A0A9W4U590_9PLEO|nr:unnamed protein product [Periconia digitata]
MSNTRQESRGPELLAVAVAFVSLAAVSTALRAYVRIFLVKAFGWDDAWMIVALLCHVLFAGCAIGGVKWGTGRHMSTLSDHDVFMAMRFWWICYIGYCWAMIAAKLSIGIFLLRVTIRPMHKRVIYLVMGLTILTGLVFFFVTLLQCRPIDYFWNRKIPGSCINVDVIIGLTFLYSIISIICDFTFAILPIFLVWSLNMDFRTRALLVPIFGMACIASVAVLCRTAFIMDFKDPDFLWATLDIAIWSDIEQGLAITAGSLATLRPLYRRITGHLEISKGPSENRASQWRSRFRTTKDARKDRDETEIGDLGSIRLRDDLCPGNNDGFTAWATRTGHSSDEERDLGQIIIETQIRQQSY